MKYSDVGIWSDDQIPGLKRIVNVVHAHGSKIGIQVFIVCIELLHSLLIQVVKVLPMFLVQVVVVKTFLKVKVVGQQLDQVLFLMI